MSDDTEVDRLSIKHAYLQVADAIATARHAIAVLRERGLIVSIHGRGTFVAPDSRTAQQSVGDQTGA